MRKLLLTLSPVDAFLCPLTAIGPASRVPLPLDPLEREDLDPAPLSPLPPLKDRCPGDTSIISSSDSSSSVDMLASLAWVDTTD